MLALAHERGCEAELADAIEAQLAGDGLPNWPALHTRFAPAAPDTTPQIIVTLPPLASYDALLPGMAMNHAATTPTTGAAA